MSAPNAGSHSGRATVRQRAPDALKPTHQTSYFRIFFVAATLGPFLVVALLWLANSVLPPADAEAFKKPLLALWAAVVGSGAVATLIGGLMRTQGKISAQNDDARPDGAGQPEDNP